MTAVLGLGLIEMILFVPLLAIGLLGTVFWVWMLIDCALHEPSEGNEKIVWILVILFAHFIGAAIYFLVRRPRRQALAGR